MVVKNEIVKLLFDLLLFTSIMAAVQNSRVDLVAVSSELSSSYVVLGRLALAQPLEEDLLVCQIETLQDIFENQVQNPQKLCPKFIHCQRKINV